MICDNSTEMGRAGESEQGGKRRGRGRGRREKEKGEGRREREGDE